MSDTPNEPAESPADAPEKVYICPACGTRYDEPTECANGHAPTTAIEYDRATVEAADGGDADALASIAKTELDATGGMAGVVVGEATPPDALSVPAPVPAETATEPAPVEPAPAEPAPAEPGPVDGDSHWTDLGTMGDALTAIENAANDTLAAIARAKTELGL